MKSSSKEFFGVNRLLVLPFAIVVVSCLSQSSAAQCNNTGRQLQVKAGGTGQLFTTCTSVTFSVAGQSVSTPAQCETGSAYYHGTVYACQGEVQCSNCKNKGYKVTIDRFTGGGCPDTTDLMQFLGGSWDDWGSVPEALQKAMSCTKPKNDPTFDWSASVNDCPGCGESGPTEFVSGETYEGGDGSLYVYWDSPLAEFPFAPGNTSNLFLSAFDLAEATDPSVVGGYFQQVAEDHGRMVGASVDASVTIRSFDGFGSMSSKLVYGLQGGVTENGRFDLIVSWAVDRQDGEGPVMTTRRATFDGRLLTSVDARAETGNAYERTAASMIGLLEPIRPVFEWLYDPFGLPMFPGIQLDLVTGEHGELVHQRLNSVAGGQFVGSEYEFVEANGGVRPIRTTVFLPDGRKLEERRFEDYRRIRGASNSVRPALITHTFFTGGAGSQERTEVVLRVRSSHELAPEACQSVPAPASERQPWLIWL